MLKRAAIVALLALAVPAVPASAAGTVTRADATLRVIDTATVDVTIAQTPGTLTLTLGSGTVLVPQPGSGCTLAAAVITCTAADGIDVVTIDTEAGGDFVMVDSLTADLRWDAGGGDDQLFIPTQTGVVGAMTVEAQAGDDVLAGGRAADRLDAGPGDDRLFVSPGGDVITGGTGFDSLTAPDERSVSVSLDGLADDDLGDGADANVHADVEDVFSRFGSLGDRLVGSAAGNLLFTGRGDDVLVGGGGFDVLHAGGGTDRLFARDGLAEGVDCGDGTDFAQVDDLDTAIDCEVVDASADARPDADADGVRKPVDCDDGDAAVRPGAPEQLEDGIDQDCDGADAIDPDRDRDGVPRPQDCDDNRAEVRPGRREVPGNRVDENCDGRKAPFPSLRADVDVRVDAFRTHIVVTRIRLSRLRSGQRIRVSCRGRGCPFRKRSANAPTRRRRLDLTRWLARERLRPGTLLQVRIRNRRRVEKTVSFELRAADRPVRIVRCSAPPDRRLRRC